MEVKADEEEQTLSFYQPCDESEEILLQFWAT